MSFRLQVSLSAFLFFLIVYFLSLEFLVFTLSSRFFSHFWRIIKRTFLFHGALVIVLKHLSVFFSPLFCRFSLCLFPFTLKTCAALFFISFLTFSPFQFGAVMKRPVDARRRAPSAASPVAASSASSPATLTSVTVRTKPSDERDGAVIATPREKQRAAQRVAALQQGQGALDSVSTRTENNTVSSNGVTATSSVCNGAANPPSPSKQDSEDEHVFTPQNMKPSVTLRTVVPLSASASASAAAITRAPTVTAPAAKAASTSAGVTRSSNVSTSAAQATAPTTATLLAKPMRRHTVARVVARRPPSRGAALSPRHITVGATLVTPPPPAAAVSVAPSSARSPRGAGTITTAASTDSWTPRRGSISSTVTMEARRRLVPGTSPALVATTPSLSSALWRDSSFNNSGSSARSRTTQASLRQDIPRAIKATPRPRPASHVSLPAQQLLDEGFYLASDGSANSSFSDTPRSARPASLCSASSRRASMQMLDLNAGNRAMMSAAAAAAATSPRGQGVTASRQEARRDAAIRGSRSDSSSSRDSSDCDSGDNDGNSSEVDFCEEEDDGDVHYDEEDEEQAVLTYMDSGAEVSYNRGWSGSGHLASPPPRRRSNAGLADAASAAGVVMGDRDELDLSVDLGTAERDDGVDGPPSRLSVSTPQSMYRRCASSLRNSSVAREPRAASPTRRKASSSGGGGLATPPQPQPQANAAQTALSRQHSTAAPQPSSRRSPFSRPANPSPLHSSPPNASSLSLFGAPASADEESRERQCKHLSLHEAFFFNQSRSFWLVDDQVLAKVLEYVRLMGYEHPALKRDRSKGQSSLWSSSSAVSSPIVPGKLRKKSAATPTMAAATAAVPGIGAAMTALKDVSGKTMIPNMQASAFSAAAAAVADAVSQSCPANVDGTAAGAAAAAKEASNPLAFLGRQYHLRSGKPKCAGQYANTTSTSATHLFLTFSEALRWIVEQEYVIGTVLMCCARFVGDAEADGADVIGDGMADGAAWHPRRAMLQRGKPCIPVRLHPIHFVASLVLTHYPQWGGMTAFMRAWETQIHLVLGSAAPTHQRIFKCPDDGLILSSDLEAGNLFRVERAPEPYFFLIWLEPDSCSDKRIWFRFSVTGAKEGHTLRFRLMNATPHAKLYRQNGMMPVWRDGLSQPNWGPVDTCSFRTTNHDLDGEVCFSILARNSTETIQIAFCTPYSYADLLCHVCHWHALVKSSGCDMRFEERVLCRSPEGRKLHLLIVTSRSGGPPKSNCEDGCVGKKAENGRVRSSGGSGGGAAAAAAGNARNGNTQNGISSSSSNCGAGGGATATSASAAAAAAGGGGGAGNGAAPGLANPTAVSTANSKAKSSAVEVVHGPYSNFSTGKKVVLISGRVHPGEVTASHGVHGLISFLLSSDTRAIQLREHFIFFIVPMLNPDGVSRGHSRLDQYGNNLNRCYNDPDPESQPTVLALRRVFEHLQRTYRERFIMYLDFHSHASQSSGFMFGNHLPVRVQHWNIFFPRLVELQARHVFSFGLCRFGRVHMISKDGASRVLFGSSLIHSYTVELTHFTDRRLYADDYAAMNNGSAVLFEVTWPPLHSPSGQAGGTGDGDGGENGKGGGGGSVGGPRSLHPAPPTAAASLGGRDRKRATSSAAGHAKSQSSSGTAAAGARPRTASASAGAKRAIAASTPSKGEGAAPRKRGASAGAGGRGVRSCTRDSANTSASPLRLAHGGPSLQPISTPSVLCQSAEVGRACLLALLDYCSIGRQSDELTMFGGMSRVLRDVKRHVKSSSPSSSKKAKKSQAAATYANIEPIYRQY